MGQRHAPAALYPRERPGTHCTGGWVGPRAGLDKGGKSRPHRDSIPGPSSPQPVAIPTELPGLVSTFIPLLNFSAHVPSYIKLHSVSKCDLFLVQPKHVWERTAKLKIHFCADCILPYIYIYVYIYIFFISSYRKEFCVLRFLSLY